MKKILTKKGIKNKMEKMFIGKKSILTILILSVLVLSGCSGGSGSNGSRNSGAGIDISSTYVGGNSAISIEFAEGQPPKTIFAGGVSPFNIMVNTKNDGEFDVPAGNVNVVLSGINPSDFNVGATSKSAPALRSLKLQQGQKIESQAMPIIFDGLSYIPKVSGSITQNIGVDICYPYETNALISGCISGSTLRTGTDSLEVCSLTGNKAFTNSGAPIQIANVAQSTAGRSKIQIKFDIVDKSSSKNARVFESNTLDNNCRVSGESIFSTQASLSKNKIGYTFDANGLNVICQGSGPSGTALLINGKATIYCTIDTLNQGDYEQIFKVNLKYDYFDRVSTSIQIDGIVEN